jgi:hypothetical protein
MKNIRFRRKARENRRNHYKNTYNGFFALMPGDSATIFLDTTFVEWFAVRKLSAVGRNLFCDNISARMNRAASRFDDARLESGILRFVRRRRNELLIEVLMCGNKHKSELSTLGPTFCVARGKHPKCVSLLKQFVPTLKIFAVTKQICNVTMPSKKS